MPKAPHRLALQTPREGKARIEGQGEERERGVLTRKSTKPSGRTRSLVSNPPWHGLVLAAILALSAFLNLFRITQEGYGNVYYAATVKNMLASWSNFFFVSYDAGFVSVDKPPL